MVGLAQNLSFILLGEDKSASKTMDAAAASAERTTGRIGAAFSKVGGVLGGQFGGVLDKVGSGLDGMGGKAAKLSTGLMVGGGIATAAGVGLLQFGSAGVQATDQLDQAIKSAGGSASDFADKIDKAVQKGENFDHSVVDTKSALTKLTEATGSTQKALDNMQVVTDLAAAKHISLADAAGLVARVLAGSGTRTLAQYGIVQQKAVDGAKLQAAAQLGVQKATTTLAAAQLKLTNLEDIDHAKKKLTIQDHIALQAAQDNVTKASGTLKTAQDKLAASQDVGITKTQAGQKALEELAQKLSGQGSASVNNFGSQIDIMKTKVVDWAEEVSGPVGQVLTGLGPLFTIAGVAVDLYRTKKEAAILAEIASTAATTDATVATEAETAAQVGLDGAMDANPIGIVAAALGGLALVAGGIAFASQKDLTKATSDYTGVLMNQNGVMETNIEDVARKALLDDGSLAAAAKLGISTNLVVLAATGHAAAQAELNKELAAANNKLADQSQKSLEAAYSHQVLRGGIATTTQAERDAKSDIDKLTGGVADQSQALKDARRNADLYSSSLSTVRARADAASSSRYAGEAAAYANRGHAGGGDIHGSQVSMVGEQGPELVALPGGSHVFPSGSGPSGGGGGGISIVVNAGAIGNDAFLARTIVTAVTNAARLGQIPKNALSTALTGH